MQRIKLNRVRLVLALLLLAGLSLTWAAIRFARTDRSSLATAHSPRAESALRCVARDDSDAGKSGPPLVVLVNSAAGPSQADRPPEWADLQKELARFKD